MMLSLTFIFPLLSFFSPREALAISDEHLEMLAKASVSGMAGAGTDPEFQRGSIKAIEPMMRVPPEVLDNLCTYSFLNTHQTGTTKGVKVQEERAEREMEMIGLGKLKLPKGPEEIIADFNPKYGYFNYGTEGEAARKLQKKDVDSYGKLLLVFDGQDKDLKSRMTYSLEDSLSNQQLSTTHPMSDLAALEEYQKGKGITKDYDPRYLEVQVWGPLNMGKVKEIVWTGEDEPDDKVKAALKRAIKAYGIKVYRQDKQSTAVDKNKHIQMNKVELFSAEELAANREVPFNAMKGPELVERYKQLLELTKGKKPLEAPKDFSDMSVVESQLVRQGYFREIPDELSSLRKRIERRLDNQRPFLMRMTLAKENPDLVASSIITLLEEKWPTEKWIDKKNLESLLKRMEESPAVMARLLKRFGSRENLICAMQASLVTEGKKAADLKTFPDPLRECRNFLNDYYDGKEGKISQYEGKNISPKDNPKYAGALLLRDLRDKLPDENSENYCKEIEKIEKYDVHLATFVRDYVGHFSRKTHKECAEKILAFYAKRKWFKDLKDKFDPRSVQNLLAQFPEKERAVEVLSCPSTVLPSSEDSTAKVEQFQGQVKKVTEVISPKQK